MDKNRDKNGFFDDDRCFVCGKRNDRGLRLNFDSHQDPDRVESEVVFPPAFQGWSGVVHGGLLSTVLDEVMVKAAESRGLKCVTAEIRVKFKKPVPTGATCRLTGRVNGVERRIVSTEGHISDPEGRTLAAASARLYRVD